MPLKTCLYAAIAISSFFVLALFSPTQAGQLFPPILSDPANNNACNSNQVLGWTTNGTVKCIDPTPGVTVTCPAGKVVTSINGGTPTCVYTAPHQCHTVTALGNSATAPGTWAAHAICAANEFMLTGGGRSQTGGSDVCTGGPGGQGSDVGLSFMHTNRPDNTGNGWLVDAYKADGSGEACTEAYAICCSVQ